MSTRTQPTFIDTRYVFRAYAALTGVGGFLLFSWGPAWFGAHLEDHLWLKAELIRLFGAILMAAACTAAAISQVEDPATRHKALGWFTLAHGIVGGAAVMQAATIGQMATPWAANLLMSAAFVFFFFWRNPDGRVGDQRLVTLFGASEPNEKTRSRYEEQIRQAASIEERNRLARDLHDSVKQQLFVIQTAAATAQARFASDPEGAREAIDQVRGGAREAIAEMQAMLDQLRATPLDNTGMVEALKKQAEALGFRTSAKIHFEIGQLPPNDSVSPGAHEALFRSGQEAFSNIARHARAKNVWVQLDAMTGKLTLRIRDDGEGFDTNQGRRGMGLANIHTRAQEFGGIFEISSRPGGGTSIAVAVPYFVPRKEDHGSMALIMGAVLLLSIPSLLKNYSVGWVTALVAIEFTRQLTAYIRTRKSNEVAP
jgi:signal transduction histidine kinase